MHHLSIDIETYCSVDLKKCGLYRYVQSADLEILLFAYSLDHQPVQVIDLAQGEPLPDEILKMLADETVVKHAYNAAFEINCLAKFYAISNPTSWRCTMAHGLYCGYPAGLERISKAMGLASDKAKMDIGKALIRYFSIPCKPTKVNSGRTRNLPRHDPAKWELFKTYCGQDVVAEMTVEDRLAKYPMPAAEQRLWELDLKTNQLGVRIDTDLVDGAIDCAEEKTKELMAEATSISRLDNPNSAAQLKAWLAEEGVETSDLTKKTVKDLLAQVDLGPAKRILEIRQELAKTSVKKYEAMRSAVCDDDRVRGLLQYYGANRSGRWAGRLVQVQNLPRNYLDDLAQAREWVKCRNSAMLELVYGSVSDTLSQLIRTAFVPSDDHIFLVADFSAIEARVIAWLAGEEWRLEVFRTHGKIYEASASQMFHVPIDRIVKGNPEYALRQKGKIAELALGYQGASGALMAMGALDMGLEESELPGIVTRWRRANPKIVSMWRAIEDATKKVLRTGEPQTLHRVTIAREIDVANDQDFLTIQLPSGRKLYYVQPVLVEDKIKYHAIEQGKSTWGPVDTYGGKLVENCLSGDTLVLTNEGWVRLDRVTKEQEVWDGTQWVRHEGLIAKGKQEVISVDGIRMTPDHKIYTQGGWSCASQSEKYSRYAVRLPDGSVIRRVKRQKITVDHPLRSLWENVQNVGRRVLKRQTEILRMYATQADRPGQHYAWAVASPVVSRLAINERTLSAPYSSGLAKLWRTRNQGLRPLAGKLREFLGRHGSRLSPRVDDRPYRCKWRLQHDELSLGQRQSSVEEQTEQSTDKHTVGRDDRCGSGRKIWHWRNHTIVPAERRMPGKYVVCKTGRYKQVYDLRNAGPKHCFTVLSDHGPILVHNCTQAIARDCLAVSLLRLADKGYNVVFHVHDEAIVEAPADGADVKEVCKIMGAPISWAPGLPLRADGFSSNFYKKE